MIASNPVSDGSSVVFQCLFIELTLLTLHNYSVVQLSVTENEMTPYSPKSGLLQHSQHLHLCMHESLIIKENF